MILAIDPGSSESAYALIDKDYKPIKIGKVPNDEIFMVIVDAMDCRAKVVIEMIASYGMAVGAEVFDTCVWIGRFQEYAMSTSAEVELMKRKEVKMNLCNSMRAKDSNITQALIDRFAYGQKNMGKGTKKEPGWFHGFSKDIWQAYALGITYLDKLKESEA